MAGGKVYVLKRDGRTEGDLFSQPLDDASRGQPPQLVGHLDHVSEEPGLAVDPKRGIPVFPRVIVDDSDIGLMTLQKGH